VIETKNLQLIPSEPLRLATILVDKKGLEPLLDISIPDSWPAFPEAMPRVYEQLSSDSSSVGWAFSHPNVAAVMAETLPNDHGSIRVLEKLGMRFVGATDEVLRWRLDRRDFEEEGGTL
jgi:hypothetical protein